MRLATHAPCKEGKWRMAGGSDMHPIPTQYPNPRVGGQVADGGRERRAVRRRGGARRGCSGRTSDTSTTRPRHGPAQLVQSVREGKSSALPWCPPPRRRRALSSTSTLPPPQPRPRRRRRRRRRAAPAGRGRGRAVGARGGAVQPVLGAPRAAQAGAWGGGGGGVGGGGVVTMLHGGDW